jgi:hypothetical protein
VPTGISTDPAGAVVRVEAVDVDDDDEDGAAADAGAEDGGAEDGAGETEAGFAGRGAGAAAADEDGAEDDDDDETGLGDSPRARERRSSMRSRTSAYSLRASERSLRSFTFKYTTSSRRSSSSLWSCVARAASRLRACDRSRSAR